MDRRYNKEFPDYRDPKALDDEITNQFRAKSPKKDQKETVSVKDASVKVKFDETLPREKVMFIR